MKTLILTLFLLTQTVFAQTPSYDFIQVSGEAEAKIKPDYVMIFVIVFTRAPSAQSAQKQNAKEMARVDKVLRTDFKIDAKDIQTSGFQVAPQYEFQRDRQVYKGMTVSHSVVVKYRKIDDVGNLLDRLLDGASQENFGVRVEQIQFGSDQVRTVQTQTLEQAVSEARARAQVLAKASGRTLSQIRKITDLQTHSGGFVPMQSMKTIAMDSMESASTQIAPGELTVKANVQVEFELK